MFIDAQRERFGVEPICRGLLVAPSAYRLHLARLRNSSLLPARARRDAVLVDHIELVHRANLQVYGVRKVWRQMRREGNLVSESASVRSNTQATHRRLVATA